MRLLHRLVSRLPLTIRLRTGVIVDLRFRIDGQDSQAFWDVFTGRDYLPFLPAITKALPMAGEEVTIIDGGAGSGMFSLFMEHSLRAGLVDWKSIHPVAIEPAPYNYRQLCHNMRRNFQEGSYEVIQGVVGKRTGDISFHASKSHPWSSSVIDRPEVPTTTNTVPFVDLAPYLERGNCIVKLDIEGGEFLFVEAYHELLGSVDALLLEWHKELGDYEAAERVLEAGGLRKSGVGTDGIRRITRLYLRERTRTYSFPGVRQLEGVT